MNLPPGFELDAPSAESLSGVPTPPGVTRLTVSAGQPSLPAGFELDGPNIAGDMARSAWSGVNQGVAGLVGLPDTVANLGAEGIDAATKFISRNVLGRDSERPSVGGPLQGILPTAKGVKSTLDENISGAGYKPQTTYGEYARSAGEFLPGALAGPGGVVGNAIRYGVIPGVASEAAGQLTKGTAAEPVARGVAALGAGGIAGLASRPGTAARAIRGQMPEGVTPQMVNQADALMQQAAQQGVTLTWPEALSQVAGRPVLSNMARHLEATAPTEGRMAEIYGQRPQQVEVAGRQALGGIAPPNAAPSTIGPQAGQASSEILDRVRGAINTATRPSYDAARQSLVPQNVHAAMLADPLFANALNALRNDVERNVTIRGLSDRNVIVYDAVKQALAERGRNLANPAQPFHSNTAAANVGSLSGDVSRVAVASDRAAMGLQPGQGIGNLEHALAEQARLRQQYLEPLQRGPLGRIADRDITTKKAINALFPTNPLPNSEHEIAIAVGALAHRNPRIAGDLVRAHTESVFNEATQALQSGANQAGGAKFAAVLVGNPQQRANFEAAVRALPHGDARLAGFNRFLDVLEATGTRQNIGSKTAYNAEFLRQSSSSGIVGEIAKGAANPISRFTQGLVEKYERYRLGQNLNELADILTNPAAVGQLRAIARMPPGSRQAEITALRIVNLTNAGASGGVPVNQTRQ